MKSSADVRASFKLALTLHAPHQIVFASFVLEVIPLKRFLTLCLISLLGAAHAHDEHAPTRVIMPASAQYQLSLPSNWYDSRRFDQPLPDEGDKLYIAETEVMFEAWRRGAVLGPVVQVLSSPAPEGKAGEVLRQGLSLPVEEERLEPHTINGYPALSVRDFPYRGAPESGLTVLLAGDTLYHFLYAADKPEHLHEAEAIVESFALQEDAATLGKGRGEVQIAAAGNLAGLIGKPAPGFEAAVMGASSEERVTLESVRGKTVVLNFWATMCFSCRLELPLLQQAAADRDDVEVYAINWREAPGVIRQFTEQLDEAPTILLDRAGLISDRYGVSVLPATLIIDAEGIVRAAPQFEAETTLEEVKGWLGAAN